MKRRSITVSRAELGRALRLATVGVRGKTTAKVRFSVVNGFLEIMGPGAAHSIPAEGTWPSAILADAGVLKRVASRLPVGDPAVLKVENSRLYIGSFSVEATVLDIAPTGTQLPIGATGAEILIAIERLTEARVAGSIGTQAIENAREELLARIDQAVHALESYGIAQTEVASLVRRAIHEKATGGGPKNRTWLTEKDDNRDTVKNVETPLASAEQNANDLALDIRDADEQALEYARAHHRYLLDNKPEILKELQQTGELNSYLASIGQQASDHYHTILSRLQTSPEVQNLPYHQKVGRLQGLPHVADEVVRDEIIYQPRDDRPYED